MRNSCLRDIVGVRSHFHRSVQLIRDWREQRGLREYLLTSTGQGLASQILASLESPDRPRSWSITGPYGTGKSAFALFLTDLLCNLPPIHEEGKVIKDRFNVNGRPFLPTLLVGQRAPIVTELLTSLSESLEPTDLSIKEDIDRAIESKEISVKEVVKLIEQTAHAVRNEGYGGLLIVLDEFGKFLEYSAKHPDSEDLFILQETAEMASRSEASVLLLTILHSAFAEYLNILDESRRIEWQKVQGRFADVAFLEPPEQFLRLIGHAIEWSSNYEIREQYAHQVETMMDSVGLDDTRQRFPIRDLLPDCAPLHPITALLLWPLFRSKLAQNERSLFAFLMDSGSFGFQEFLAITSLDGELPDFYRVDQLYDYVNSTLGTATFLGDRARRWAGMAYAVDRVGSDAPPLSQAIGKTIGLINLYGASVGLRASETILKIAFNDAKLVSEALEYLEDASIIVYRRFEDAYALWEGSDVDLEACYQEAQKHVGHGKLAPRLKRAVDLRPMVAKAHYIKTGMLRFFNVDVIDGSEINLEKSYGRKTQPADGQIVYVLVSDQQERDNLIKFSKKLTSEGEKGDKLRLFSFPAPMMGLEKTLREVEIWSWINENISALQGDPVAREEVKTRNRFALGQLMDLSGEVLGLRGYLFRPTTSEWIQDGTLHQPTDVLQFQKWLSKLCDQVYNKAPDLHNELLNRENLSSAATSSRRVLIQAMLENESHRNLGIEGTPAEFSMYQSLLKEGKFHCQKDGQWRFDKPTTEWRYIWQAIEEFLDTTENGRRPFPELYSILKSPPFGMREGPIPVVICALLLARRNRVALYEDGLFVPELRIEVFERLMKAPENFEVQRYKFTAEALEAFISISNVLEVLDLSKSVTEKIDLLEVVRPLVLFAANLPDFTKRTKFTMPVEAADARDALLNARDPIKLLFEDLPNAVNGRLDNSESIADFAKKLQDCLTGLRNTYPHLLDEIESHLRKAFDLYGTSAEARQRLQSRSEPLAGYAVDHTMDLFIREASRLNDRDWREVLARVINKGMPPTHWHDADVVEFQLRLRRLSSDFIRLEELVAEQRRAETSKIFRIGLLDGKLEEDRAIIAIPPGQDSDVEKLAEQINELLEKETSKEDQEAIKIKIAAIASVARRYLQDNYRLDYERK
jgi:hypothetical protein